MNINLNLYRTFLIVAQSKSYADANNKLNISKTAIGKNIQQLEEQLNTELFYRESKGISLTAEGQILYNFIDKSLSEIEAGEKLIAQKNKLETGELVIGALSHIADFLLMNKIQEVTSKYPNLKIKITTGKDLIKLLEEHKINFAIDSTSMDIKNKDIVREELMEVQNIFISNIPIAIENIKDLTNYRLILDSEFTHTTQELINYLKQYDVDIKPSAEIDITELRIQLQKEELVLAML